MSVKSISSHVRKSLERTLTGFFILGQLVFPFMAVQPVLANGNDSPAECLDTTSGVVGSIGGEDNSQSGDLVEYDAGDGNNVDGVCIKSGDNAFDDKQHSEVLGNGTYEDSCYEITGVGTQNVKVERIGDGSDCKEISHIDVVVTESKTGNISGYKFNDLNGNSNDDNEPRLVDWTFELKLDTDKDNDFDDQTVLDTDVTDSNGEFSFSDLDAGKYQICEVQQAGWERTLPVSSDCRTRTLDSGESETGLAFGNRMVVDYCDPSQKPGGMDIAEWLSANQIDGSDCFEYEVVQECGSLSVVFTENLTPYNYSFRYALGDTTPSVVNWAGDGSLPVVFAEDQGGGTVELTYYVVGPESDYFEGFGIPNVWDSNGVTVEVDTDCEDDEKLGSIKVKKFEDKDKDGVKNNEDVFVEDWDMILYDENWALVEELDTNDNGLASFNNLELGTYFLCEEDEQDWSQTFPDSTQGVENESPDKDDEFDRCWEIELVRDGQEVKKKFGNNKEDEGGGDRDAKITAKKFQDDDGDGQKDGNEDFLEGWNIRLYNENKVQIHSGLTDANGMVVFDNLAPGTYFVCEVLQPGWNQTSPTSGEPAIGENEAEFCIEENLIGLNVVCEFGNQPPEARLLIEKTNDANDTLIPPADVTYTIHVTNPEDSSTVFNAVVGDVLPAGFTFTGSFQVLSDVRGDISLTANPAYNANNFGTWQLGTLVPGEEVDIIYGVTIDEDVPAGTYENIAFVEGCAEDNKEVCEKPVVGRDMSPEEEDDKFAESEVTVGAVLGVSQPRVLAVTGTPMASSLVVGSLVSSLAGLLTLSRKQLRALRRKLNGFKKKMSRAVTLVVLFSLLSAVPAMASTWTLRVADLDTVRNDSVELTYSVATINEADSFAATLDVDGPVDDNDADSFSGSQSRTFDVSFPEDGSYTLTVSVENQTQSQSQSDTQTITVDTDGDGNGNGSQSSAGNGGSAFSGAGLVGGSDQFGVVSTTAATDSNQADDAEGEEQAATDDQTEEVGDEADENGSEDEDSNVWPTILTIAAVALVGYYFLSRRAVE